MPIKYRLYDRTFKGGDSWESLETVALRGDALIGAVEIAHEKQYLRFSARFVLQLQIDKDAETIHLALSVEPPLQDYPTKGAANWKLDLNYSGGQWRVKANVPWLNTEASLQGKLGEWLRRDGRRLFRLKSDFPFERLGLLQKPSTAGAFSSVRIGLFPATQGTHSSLLVVCVPDESPGENVLISGDLALSGFGKTRVQFEGSVFRGGLIGHLDANTALRDGLVSLWLSAFQWPAVESLAPYNLIGATWNRIAHANAVGRRGADAGRPWWPVPTIELEDVDRIGMRQRLIFAPSRDSSDWRLIKMTHAVSEEDRKSIRGSATFAWYSDDTVGGGLRARINAKRVITVVGGIELPVEGNLPDRDTPAAGAWIAGVVHKALFDAQARCVVSWEFSLRKYAAAPSQWLGMGSVDVHPTALLLDKARLECELDGTWHKEGCDIYTTFRLDDLPCRFRMSNTGDPLPKAMVAQFDVANRLEDELQRATSPVVASLDVTAGSIEGKFHVRLRAESNRDSVLQLRLTRDTPAQNDGKSLYLQARPFNFARIWPAHFDEEAGLDFAYWRSDDPEGPQWRLPDSSVEFDLTPQTVAEEMERGQRFWKEDKRSYIDATKPVRFRFSPPTHVRVRPGRVDRRYHSNANNLSDILDGARVEAFDTELLYPIRLRFEIDADREPVIDIAESGTFMGRPTANLPIFAEESDQRKRPVLRALLNDLFPDDIAEWFFEEAKPSVGTVEEFTTAYDRLRWEHSANRAQFVARVAQFHVHDPYLPDRQLMLSDGLTAAFRTPESERALGSMPPLINPLPIGADLDKPQREAIKPFLRGDLSWVDPANNTAGALRAGAIHTMEFPSELVAVLRKPGAVSTFIDTLSFSVLGANGSSSVSFDEGRTTFSVEIADGQVWRIRKVRLGRVALFWNKAKHVVVYERSVLPSEQFQAEQPDRSSLGWPILRKTEEYVEPIEMIRVFDAESDSELGSPGFAHSSEFITPRIYVNGSWGRDLGHGYEIPLWNKADTSGFYPKPLAAINAHTGTGEYSKAWHENPEELYFYTNTEESTGADSNNWKAFHGVDLTDAGPSRLANCTNASLEPSKVLDAERLSSPRTDALRRKRFDLLVRTDGPVNLQHGRGETEMLAAGMDVLSLARTSATSPTPVTGDSPVAKAVQSVSRMSEYTARVDHLRDQAQTFVRELPALFLKYQTAPCDIMREEMRRCATALFTRVEADAKVVFDQVPEFDVPDEAAKLVGRLRQEMFAWALPLTPSFAPIIEELRKQIAEARKLADENAAEFDVSLEQIRKRLKTVVEMLVQAFLAAQRKIEDGLIKPIDVARDALTQLSPEISRFVDDASAWWLLQGQALKNGAKQIQQDAEQLATRLQALAIPMFATVLKRLELVVRSISQIAEEIDSVTDEKKINDIAGALRTKAQGLLKSASELLLVSRKIADTLTKSAVDQARVALDELMDAIDDELAPVWGTPDFARQALGNLLALLDKGLNHVERTAQQVFEAWRASLESIIDKVLNGYTELTGQKVRGLADAIHALSLPVAAISAELRKAKATADLEFSACAKRVRSEVEEEIEKLADACNGIGDSLNTVKEKIESKAQAYADALEERVTALVTSIVDEAAVERTQQWSKDLEAHKDKIGKGIKLVKAIGNLPELPHLKFNVDRVEYVFDDLRNQIETSPFAARMREIDSGLKELGLAVPVRKLLDQLIPDQAALDFNKVFRDLGGMDFRKLFKNFQIPRLEKDNIKITHGIDKSTRTAWLKALVSTSYPEPQEVFAAGPLAVKTAAMSLRASSDVRIDLHGKRQAATRGELRANWSLDLKGTKLVTFRDVSVTLDNGKFDFNISPDKVELHPSLKFVSDITKAIGEKLPPTIELIRDSRGVVSGARANMTTLIEKPITLGAVKIGALMLTGGLALTLEEGFKFAIVGHIAVGTKSAPIFVQINFLGGGMWLDAQARFIDGKVTYVGSVGLALGSTESFNIGGVARGSYSLLLFANAQFQHPGGGAFRAGLSITGCARILGTVNAYVMLLLEVIHGEGKAKGHGMLDVEVRVCKWYKIGVHKQVERSL